jgi:hypothetical protein
MVFVSVISARLPDLESSPGGLPARSAVTWRAYGDKGGTNCGNDKGVDCRTATRLLKGCATKRPGVVNSNDLKLSKFI